MKIGIGLPRTRHSYWMVFSIFLGVFLFVGQGIAAEQQIAGRYKHRGREIRHKIRIPQEPPAAAILVQYLPPGTEIEKAVPKYSSYNMEKGVVKWLFSDVQPGILKVRLSLQKEVVQSKVSAEVLFIDTSGVSNTFSVVPRTMKRTAIEGC